MADKKKQEKKDFTGIASMEAMLEKYIDNSIISIFKKKTSELDKKQNEEYDAHYKEWSKYPQLNPEIAVNNLNEKGKWQNKGFDWVISETNKEFQKPQYEKHRQDIEVLISNYRSILIKHLGEKKYNELTKKYGEDLAIAQYKKLLLNKMEDQMIKHKMPKSEAEYAIKKIFKDSLYGFLAPVVFPNNNKSQKDKDIENAADERYDASWITDGISNISSSLLSSTLLPMKVGTSIKWGIGFTIVGKGLKYFTGDSKDADELDKDIYGARTSKEDINKAKKSAKSVEIQKEVNLSLNNKIRQKYSPSEATAISKNYERAGDPDLILKAIKEAGIKVSSRAIPQHMKDKDLKENYRLACYFMGQLTEMKMSGAKTIKVGDTTLTEAQVAQRAHDYAYQAQEQVKEIKARELEEKRKNEIDDLVVDENGDMKLVAYARDSKKGQELAAAEASQSQQQQNQQMVNDQMNNGFGGWASMLGWGGGELPTNPQNISQVISSIPDLLVGMFTGKNKHLKLSECFFPIAAIMGAMFFKNPIIKLLLFLAGGMMLFQKAKNNMNEENKQNEYRSYKRIPDEPLNPRIKNPVMKGNTLVANIDDCPYVITVSDQAVDAYHKGYIPINALSNKVLEVFDRQQGQIQSDFNQNVTRDEEQQRTRGIK